MDSSTGDGAGRYIEQAKEEKYFNSLKSIKSQFFMKQLSQWFKFSHHFASPYITDKHGKKFGIMWEDDCLAVFHRNKYIGRVNLVIEHDHKAIIADNIILDPELRRRGLGKAMLQEAIRYAREHEVRLIRGRIQPDEITSAEYLAEWYRRQGFDVDAGLNISLIFPKQ